MQEYINHLIEDLRAAGEIKITPPYIEVDEDEECVRGAIEYLNGPSTTFQKLFEIDKACFPPVEKLTEDQIQNLVNAILSLWQAHNFYADLPQGLPAHLAYVLLINKWDSDVQYISSGQSHLEFYCYEENDDCKIKEWCQGKWCGWVEENNNNNNTLIN